MYIQHEVMKMNPLFPPIRGPDEEKNQASDKVSKKTLA